MPLAARQTDAVSTGHGCDGSTTLATPSQSTVFAEGLLWCRKTDLTVSHDIGNDIICTPHTAPITGSSSTVYVEGLLCARKSDACDAGSITGSAATVYAG